MRHESGHQNVLHCVMFYVYVLKSRKAGHLYVSYSSDLRRRFAEHNAGKVRSTKAYMPHELVYYEAYRVKEDAVTREHNLKLRARALRQLLLRIRSSTGVTAKARLVKG